MLKKSLGQIGSTDQSQVQSQFLFLHILASFPKKLQKFPKIFKNLDVFEKEKLKIDSFRMHWEKEVVQTSRLTKTKPLNN